tara:strand:- start:480 stop:959 length:480 start_codon:yes stop_codon:yes gene_type:complete
MTLNITGALKELSNKLLMNNITAYLIGNLYSVALIIAVVSIIIVYNLIEMKRKKDKFTNLIKSMFYIFIFVSGILNLFIIINRKEGGNLRNDRIFSNIYGNILNNNPTNMSDIQIGGNRKLNNNISIQDNMLSQKHNIDNSVNISDVTQNVPPPNIIIN